jgi:2-polyprenyl-3-methyl-5-hydroxy-6-metoxy-1,4-benzoquinol methylase
MPSEMHLVGGYRWKSACATCAHAYTLPHTLRIIHSLGLEGEDREVFDLGCGNGAVMAVLQQHGYHVVGSIHRLRVLSKHVLHTRVCVLK